MQTPVKVLSIDGGGIRGIIPARILADIENRLYRLTGKKRHIAEMFDLIAGTSTGGILALGLTKPGADNQTPKFFADKLVELYASKGEDIFPRNIFNKMRSIFNERYTEDGLESVLKEYFGDTLLSQAVKKVLIPSYETGLRRPYWFNNFGCGEQGDTGYFKMKDVARATSAAPTYFEPFPINNPSNNYSHTFIDGGVFANNPAMCAYVEARKIYPDQTNFIVVSLGTGELTKRLPYEKIKDWGMLQWAQPIIDVTFDGISDTVNYQLRRLLSTQQPNKSYYRFQTSLHAIGDSGDSIDDASVENINYLQDLATDLINREEDNLEELCRLLIETDSLRSEAMV